MHDADERINILYYLPSINRFADENWCIIHDLYKLFDAWQLDIWKKTKDYGIVVAKNGDLWRLYYLDPDGEDDAYDFIGWQQSFELCMDRPCY